MARGRCLKAKDWEKNVPEQQRVDMSGLLRLCDWLKGIGQKRESGGSAVGGKG